MERITRKVLDHLVTRINGYLKDIGSKFGYGLEHGEGRYYLYVVNFKEFELNNSTLEVLRSLNGTEMYEYLKGIDSLFGNVLIRNGKNFLFN